MKTRLNHIIETTLKRIISEAPAQETDNAKADAGDSIFTPAEEKFLGKFDAYGTEHLGIIYSVSDIGIREFIGRSGKDLNITPHILLNLLKQGIVKIVPYTGWGRNDDYTIELQIGLDAVKGLGAEDKKNIESGTAGGGAAPASEPPAMEMPPGGPGPEVAWVVKYGDILRESVKITKELISESSKAKKQPADTKIMSDKTRVLQRLPKEYIHQLDRAMKMMDKKAKTSLERERIIADMLDVLQLKLKLTPKEIRKSYDFHKSQKRLQKYLETK
jgi:hypothetical protein